MLVRLNEKRSKVRRRGRGGDGDGEGGWEGDTCLDEDGKSSANHTDPGGTGQNNLCDSGARASGLGSGGGSTAAAGSGAGLGASRRRRGPGRGGLVGDNLARGLGRVAEEEGGGRLEVRLGDGSTVALLDRLERERRVGSREGFGKEVVDGEVHSNWVEVVLERNKLGQKGGRGRRRVSVENLREEGDKRSEQKTYSTVKLAKVGVKEGDPLAVSLGRVDLTGRNVEVLGVKEKFVVVAIVDSGPHDGLEVHLGGNGSNSVVNVSLCWKRTVKRPRRCQLLCLPFREAKERTRRSEGEGRDAGDVLDELPRPSELGNNLLVGQGRQGRVTPGVSTNLVSEDVLLPKNVGLAERSGTDNVEGRLEVVVAEVVEQDGRVERRSVVERQSPTVLLRALDDVGLVGALSLFASGGRKTQDVSLLVFQMQKPKAERARNSHTTTSCSAKQDVEVGVRL